MDGLQILGFDAKKVSEFRGYPLKYLLIIKYISQVMAHPKVLEWNKTLEEVRSPSSDAVEIYGK